MGVGLPLVLLLIPKQHPVAIMASSYLIGIGLFTFAMFLVNLAGFRFSLVNESVLLFAISAPLIFIKKKEVKEFFIHAFYLVKKAHFSTVEKWCLGFLVFIGVSSLINTLYWPVSLWDSLVLYDFRAHIFAASGFMKEAFIDNYYTGYPLLTSLAHTIVYIMGGEYPQFLHSFFYLSLGAGFYGFLREFVSRKTSLFFTVILLIVEPLFYHSLISYTNLAYTVYLSLGAICVYLWDKKKERGYLIVSALLVALSTWTRSVEPFWLGVFIVVFIVATYRKKFRDILTFTLFFFPIHEAWKVFQFSLTEKEASTVGEIVGYAKIILSVFDPGRWLLVGEYLYTYVVTPWGTIFAVFIISTILMLILRKLRKFFLSFFITFTLLGVLVLGTFAFSIGYAGTLAIGDAAKRLSMLFYPLFIFCIALVMQELVKIKK